MCTEKAYRLKIVDFDEVSERKEYVLESAPKDPFRRVPNSEISTLGNLVHS